MPIIDANGTGIYVECHGDPDGTPILLVRGLGSQIIHWPDAMIGCFVDHGMRVIVPDNRDAGLSQKLDELETIPADEALRREAEGLPVEAPYSIGDIASDHVGVLDHFGFSRAHIFGVSMGGMIVQTMAVTHPERVITMTSVMSSSGNPELPPMAPEVQRLLLASPDDPDDRDSVIDFTLACDRVWGSPGYPFDENERANLIGRAFDRCYTPSGVLRQYLAVRQDGSRVERLRTIGVPSLVIHGTDDTLLSVEHGRDTAANIPGCVIIEIPGMGHDLEGELGPMIAGFTAHHARTRGE